MTVNPGISRELVRVVVELQNDNLKQNLIEKRQTNFIDHRTRLQKNKQSRNSSTRRKKKKQM